jgi:hypothetical protein
MRSVIEHTVVSCTYQVAHQHDVGAQQDVFCTTSSCSMLRLFAVLQCWRLEAQASWVWCGNAMYHTMSVDCTCYARLHMMMCYT